MSSAPKCAIAAAATALIDHAGGTGVVAKACNIKSPSVTKWRSRGIPREWLGFFRSRFPAAIAAAGPGGFLPTESTASGRASACLEAAEDALRNLGAEPQEVALPTRRETRREVDEALRVMDSLLNVGVGAALNTSIENSSELADLLMLLQDHVKALRAKLAEAANA